MKGTYSPEDNKLRLYPSERLDQEWYQRFRDAGFKWAPRQKLFVAPMWTPARCDLLLEFCGEIEDEDETLVARAEKRAERFEGYSDRRAEDASAAQAAAKAISDNIPFGQPILVGHHSERRARRDADRIERGMRKAINMWNTSDYWRTRAAAAIREAKYRDLPDVRARRIKKLGAQKRSYERAKKTAEECIALWSVDNLDQDRAEAILDHKDCHAFRTRSDLYANKITPQDARDRRVPELRAVVENSTRWIEHFQYRIEYETALLEQQGASDLLKPPPKKKLPPILNYDGKVTLAGMYGREPEPRTMRHMTKAEYASIHKNHRGCRYAADKSHRVRIAWVRSESGRGGGYEPIFLTDSKVHEKPALQELSPAERSTNGQ